MFFQSHPNDVAQEYEARVAAALRSGALNTAAQAGRPRRPGHAPIGKPWAGVSAWWSRRWARFIRSLQPAEDSGYIA